MDHVWIRPSRRHQRRGTEPVTFRAALSAANVTTMLAASRAVVGDAELRHRGRIHGIANRRDIRRHHPAIVTSAPRRLCDLTALLIPRRGICTAVRPSLSAPASHRPRAAAARPPAARRPPRSSRPPRPLPAPLAPRLPRRAVESARSCRATPCLDCPPDKARAHRGSPAEASETFPAARLTHTSPTFSPGLPNHLPGAFVPSSPI